MKRRTFLQYTSLGVTSSVVAACTNSKSSLSEQSSESVVGSELEKTNLTLGYLPSLAAAPLIIAQEKGFFSRQGLTVKLSKQATWDDLKKQLLDYQLDAAQALFGMPMLAQLSSSFAPMISLMGLNLNGGAITLSEKAWKAGIRPSLHYVNFLEFSDAYRAYIRSFNEPPSFAIEATASTDHYLYRYWLAAMGIDPDREVKLSEITPTQLTDKLQAGLVIGYSASDPWNQKTVDKKAGFVAYVNRDIWKGYPGKILAAMQPWVEKNPATARALVTALLESCQFCDKSENYPEMLQILAQGRYLNNPILVLEPSLSGNYNYSKLEPKSLIKAIPDFNIFHFRATSYLSQPDQANYPWRSHGIWFLTQLVRWNQINQLEYPKNADRMIDKMYPIAIYEEVAKALNIALPKDRMKAAAGNTFIDKRDFDPSQPVAYLNQFEIRANRPQIFAVS